VVVKGQLLSESERLFLALYLQEVTTIIAMGLLSHYFEPTVIRLDL
jgi:hypothetical protein